VSEGRQVPEDIREIKGDWWVNWRSFIDVRWERRLPRLVVHEKYEAHVKWVLRGAAGVGILSSLLTLNRLTAFALSVGLFAFEQLLERAIFQYTTIIITPVPTFSIDMDEITGMAFGRPGRDDPRLLDLAGFAFKRRELAERFFELLQQWNYGEHEDRDDNIRLTFVWPNRGDGYYVCMYPNIARKGVKEHLEQWEKARAHKKPGKEQQGLVMMWTMRKTFAGGSRGVKDFLARQQPGRPFWLQAFTSEDGTNPQIIYDIKPILKRHYHVANESELTRKDTEYWLVCKPGKPYRRKVVGSEKAPGPS
jgi:hypothetical protein